MAEAQRIEVHSLQGQERKEEPPLFAGDQPHKTAGCGGVSFEERDGIHLDVGVFADAIRVGVMTRVLGIPPRVAHSDDPAEDPSESVVRGATGEYLTVRRFVSEERDLGEQDAERRGHQQLQPAVPQQDESGDRSAEAHGDRGADCRIEPGRTPEQAEFAYHLRYLRVGTGDRRELSRPGVGLANRPETGGIGHDGRTGRYGG